MCSGLRALVNAIDKIDMIFSSLRCVRKSAKWYKKYFFHFLHLAIYNAYILYKSANNKTGTFENFNPQLVKDILQKYPPRRVEVKGGRVDSDDLPFWLTERHLPTSCVTEENNKHSSRNIIAGAPRVTNAKYVTLAYVSNSALTFTIQYEIIKFSI